MEFLGSYIPYCPIFPCNPEPESESETKEGSKVIQVFTLPLDKRKFDEEQSRSTCEAIMRETHTNIVISSLENQSLLLIINGKQNYVLAAKHRIFAAFHTETRNISIPKEQHRSICESQKKRLNELEKKTDTKINFPGDNIQSDIITIIGSKKGIDEVEYEIKVICAEQLQNMGKELQRISVPKIYHPFICGPNKEKLIAIMRKSGVDINIPPFSIQNDEIIIAGEKQGVAAAKKIINNIYKDMALRCKTISVEIPKLQHKNVIGLKNSGIDEILKLTEVSVEMPLSDSSTSVITLRGPRQKLVQAMEKVKLKANGAAAPFIKAPGWIQKYIIGHKGWNIGLIIKDLRKVTIEFNVKKSKIEVEGPPKQLKEVQRRLNAVVRGLINDLRTIEFHIGPKFFTYLLRKSKDVANHVQKKMGGLINVYHNDVSHSVRFEGEKLNVQIFKLHREDVYNFAMWGIDDAHEFPISKSLHKLCIGQDKLDLFQICEETNTNMNLPGEDDTMAIITIFGTLKNAKKAKLQKIEDDLNIIVTEEISIPAKFCASLNGDGGKNIRLLMEKCGGVQIKFIESDKVTIKGQKYFVEKAKQQLLERTTEAPVVKISTKKPASTKNKKKKVKQPKVVPLFVRKEEEIIEAVIRIDPKDQFILKKFLKEFPELDRKVQITFPIPGIDETRVCLKGPRYCVKIEKHFLPAIILQLKNETCQEAEEEDSNSDDDDDDELEDYDDDDDEDDKNYPMRPWKVQHYDENYRRVKITAPRIQRGRKRKTPQSFISY